MSADDPEVAVRPDGVSSPVDGAAERANRTFWDADADDYQAFHGDALAAAPAAWGVWRIPEADLGLLGVVDDRDVLELGCGGAQFGTALAHRGARVVGLDLSVGQLRHAAARVTAAGVRLPLTCATGTALPFAAASFDLVFGDHGALSFCDPDRAVAECARVLRPGGRLVFSQLTPLSYLTWDTERLRQTRRLRHRWRDRWAFASEGGTTDAVWSHGAWIRTLRTHGLVVDDLIELLAPDGATSTFSDDVPHRWARRWPAEQIWVATKP